MKLLRRIFITHQKKSRGILIRYLFTWRKKIILLKNKQSYSSTPYKYTKSKISNDNNITSSNITSSPSNYHRIATFSPSSTSSKGLQVIHGLKLSDLNNWKNEDNNKGYNNKSNQNKSSKHINVIPNSKKKNSTPINKLTATKKEPEINNEKEKTIIKHRRTK